jgi:pimeloyl-ACP methyl ester carboxylesterase
MDPRSRPQTAVTAQQPLREEVVPFTAGDGRALNLVHVRSEVEPARGPVLLVHGAGVSADIFRAPVATNVVDALVARGWDVWLENWRASIRLEPNTWNLDEAAVYDHPVAVRTVLERTGADTLPALIHCQGSTSFMMSAVAGLMPQVSTIVSNAVSLHPVVPPVSRLKNRVVVPLEERLLRYMDPTWGFDAPNLTAKAMALAVWLTHHECESMTCRMVSFVYGSGHPALWRHENLNAETHGEWLSRNFAYVPLSFFAQMHRCIELGHLVSVSGLQGLPDDFTAQPPQTDARFSFFAGELNQCFSPESQVLTHEFFERHLPGRTTLYVIPGYSHLDIFMGQKAAVDVFPIMLSELERES